MEVRRNLRLCAAREEPAWPHLFASHTKQQFCRSHKAMRSLKLAQCLSHLPQQLLLLRFSELPYHASGQPACCRLQESIERSVMGLKWKSTGDDLVKASFREFPLKDSWIGESKGIRSVRGRSSRICCHNGKRQGKERIAFRCRPDQCRKFPTRFGMSIRARRQMTASKALSSRSRCSASI